MGSNREGNHRCGHAWRRPKKEELNSYDSPKYHVVCSKCGIMVQIPFDMIQLYDIYFPSFPEDDEDQ